MPRPSLATLRRFAGQPASRETTSSRKLKEQCELCSIELGPEHRHLLETEKREIVCACDPCALRFENVVDGRFKLVPRDARAMPEFQISDADWENLALPINLAFFFYNTAGRRTVAMYPSPAGATESLLPLPAWESLVRQNQELGKMQEDVEALLVNRVEGKREYFIAPIDLCYELVGTIRMHWRGLSGGEEVWREIERFFAHLKGNA